MADNRNRNRRAFTLLLREVHKHQSVTCALSEVAALHGREAASSAARRWESLFITVQNAEE